VSGAGEDREPAPPLRRTAVRGGQLALLGWATSQALTFAAYIVLARLIDPTDFGRYAAASVIIGVGGLFAESGMMSALISRRDRLDEAASTAFYSLLVSGVLLTLAALAVSPLVGAFFRSGKVTALSAALSGYLFIRALTIVPDSLLQRRFSFARRVAVDPLGAIAFAAVSIPICAGGAGAWGLVAGTYASVVVQAVLAWAFARTRPRRRLASMAMWRELAAFARPVLASEILRHVSGQLDAVMLGRFANAATLGQYRNGLRLAQQPSNAFVNIAGYVLLPTFARLSQHPERLAAAAKRVFGAIAAAAVPVSVAMAPLGVPIAVLALGARWRPAGHAIAGLSGVLVGAAIISVVAEVLKAVHRPELLVRIHGVNLAATAVGVLGAAVPFGLLGVAIAVSAGQLIAAVYAYQCVAGLIDVSWRDLGRTFAPPAFAAAVMLAAMLVFASAVDPLAHGEAGGLALTAAEVSLGALAYAATLIAIDDERRGDARRLVSRLTRR
jgi:PST family polysaccharide transporter